jgi:hypothetical protein
MVGHCPVFAGLNEKARQILILPGPRLEQIPPKLKDFGVAHDQEKWTPVFRPVTRQLKDSDHVYHFRTSGPK